MDIIKNTRENCNYIKTSMSYLCRVVRISDNLLRDYISSFPGITRRRFLSRETHAWETRLFRYTGLRNNSLKLVV